MKKVKKIYETFQFEGIELFDEDGYPTEEILMVVEKWDIVKYGSDQLLELVRNLWNWREDLFILKGKKIKTLVLHTGGWSGNESIIYSLKRNFVFWGFYWEKHIRGGHYYFKIK